MRHRIILLLFMAFAAVCAPRSAAAQFWKKKHHKQEDTTAANGAQQQTPPKETRKEQRRRERDERKREKKERKEKRRHKKGRHEAVVAVAPVAPQIINKDPDFPLTMVKSRYRVEVLASLYLDELAKSREAVPEKAKPGMSFYLGLQIAADSLKKAGYNIDIYIHDVASVSEPLSALMSGGKLDSADLIIGAVPGRDVPALAEFAKKRKVNFVSAVSASDGGVRDNPYFTMLEPALKTHCEYIAAEVAKSFPGRKVLVLHRTNSTANENAFRYLTDDTEAHVQFLPVLCNELPSRDSLAPLLDSARPNAVVIPVLDIAFADSVLGMLSGEFPGIKFEVYGMPTWSNARFMKYNDFTNETIHVSYAFRFEPSSANVQYVSRLCRNVYSQLPTEMVYRGYEAMFWYAWLLKHYGTIFNNNYNDVLAAPFTKFEVGLHWDKEGNILFNENNHLSMSAYEPGNRAE